MSALTKLCRDQPCYVRLPGICNGNPETTVPAHVRLIGVSGMGMKAPDLLACPACSDCHDAIDRRRYMNLDREHVQLAHFRGVMRWQCELLRRELICIGVGV